MLILFFEVCVLRNSRPIRIANILDEILKLTNHNLRQSEGASAISQDFIFKMFNLYYGNTDCRVFKRGIKN